MSARTAGIPVLPGNKQIDEQGKLRHLLMVEGLGAERIIDILDIAESFLPERATLPLVICF